MPWPGLAKVDHQKPFSPTPSGGCGGPPGLSVRWSGWTSPARSDPRSSTPPASPSHRRRSSRPSLKPARRFGTAAIGSAPAAGLRAHIRRLGADVTLAVTESHRLPESMEAALYVCGRLLVDAVSGTAGALNLAVSREDVHLVMTAPTGVNDVADMKREHALRLLGDRLAVLGGAVTTSSSERVIEIRCQVPLSAEDRAESRASTAR